MVKKAELKTEPTNWRTSLERYREARATEPGFYYNELADRGRALSAMRPVLENFLLSRTTLTEFTLALARQSRQEVSAARGRAATRYWRFNSAGRLFLDSYVKLSEELGRLNAAASALQQVVAAPPTLDAANQNLEAFVAWLSELEAEGEKRRVGQAAYVASYFWAVQQPSWPVYERTIRDQLASMGRLRVPERGQNASEYTAFYLAFTRLANELAITNYWELESFLQWLARRDTAAARVLSNRSSRAVEDKGRSLRQQRARLEELRRLLEPVLRSALGETLSGREVVQGGWSPGLIFEENGPEQRPFRLELRRDGEQKSWLAGASFEGLSRAALVTTASSLLNDLRGFLAERPAYRFYQSSGGMLEEVAAQALTEEILSEEFWLLQPVAQLRGAALVETLVSDWRLLYPFAARLITSSEESLEPEVTPPEELPAAPPFEYGVNNSPLRAVAEAPASYILEPQVEPEAVQPAPVPPRDEAANQEVVRLARLKPAPLTSDQLEALTAYIKERLIISPEKISELVTHLESGRSLLLVGPPGSGKTRLARLLAGQMGAPDPGWAAESEATNYTLATATAEWSQYDTIGGIRPGLAGEGNTSQSLFYYFEPGVVARAALCCEESLRRTGRPHYLIIDEFNRANQERAFGELFTLLEYRDRPVLPGARLGRAADLFLPEAFRIIGTLNPDDRNTLFDMGLALRRRFAMVEIGLPPPDEERRFLPRAVKARLAGLELLASSDFADSALRSAADQLTSFVAAIRPDQANPGGGGRAVGTAPLIESLLFCAVATTYYDNPAEALEDAILANILPQLEGSTSAIKRALSAVAADGPLPRLSRVRAALQRFF